MHLFAGGFNQDGASVAGRSQAHPCTSNRSTFLQVGLCIVRQWQSSYVHCISGCIYCRFTQSCVSNHYAPPSRFPCQSHQRGR